MFFQYKQQRATDWLYIFIEKLLIELFWRESQSTSWSHKKNRLGHHKNTFPWQIFHASSSDSCNQITKSILPCHRFTYLHNWTFLILSFRLVKSQPGRHLTDSSVTILKKWMCAVLQLHIRIIARSLLPQHLCLSREMFLWIAVPPSVCSDKIHVFLYTILSNTVNRLPCRNYKLKGRYHLFLRRPESWHEHCAIPLIYLQSKGKDRRGIRL